MSTEVECPCCHGDGLVYCRRRCHDHPCEVCGETGYVDPDVAKARMYIVGVVRKVRTLISQATDERPEPTGLTVALGDADVTAHVKTVAVERGRDHQSRSDASASEPSESCS